ncbi:MAG TPA: DUF167 domain-containing protein [Ktedonobacterales bacterium]
MPDHKRSDATPPSVADPQPSDWEPAEALREERGRLMVALRVTPRAARDELTLDGAVVRIRVAAPPVEGAANDAVIALLARRLHLPKSSITLVRGERSRDKLVAIKRLTATEFRERCGL